MAQNLAGEASLQDSTDSGRAPGTSLRATVAPKNEASPSIEGGLFLFLAAFGIAKLYQSKVAVMWMDELFSFYTDRVDSVREVLHIQRSFPLALDPPFTHILQHFALLLGNGNLVIYRLPSFAFCIAMLGSVYLYLRRIGGVYLGAFTVCILLLTGVVTKQFDSARPYAALLGTSGVALLLWQNCLREKGRILSLIGLFLALSAGVATHYYGVLEALPLLIAEAYRSFERRKLDMPVSVAILGSFLAALSWVACLAAAKQYRAHYYSSPAFSLEEIYESFSSPLSGPMVWQRAGHLSVTFLTTEFALFLGLICFVALGLYVGYTGSFVSAPARAEWVALGTLAFLPLFGVVLSHATAGAYQARFTIEHIIGIVAALSAVFLFCLRLRKLRNGVLLLLCLAVAARTFLDIRSSYIRRAAVSAYLSELNRSALGNTKEPTIFADYELYLLLNAQYREAAPFMTKMIWVYDLDRSVNWTTTDTPDRTLINLAQFTNLPIVSYGSFVRANRAFQLFDFTHNSSSWLARGIAADGATVKPFEAIPNKTGLNDSGGLIGDNTLYEVQFPK